MRTIFNGSKLRSERKLRKMTQSYIAEGANISDRYVRYLEAGEKNNPSAVVVFNISQLLDVPASDLMTMEGDN